MKTQKYDAPGLAADVARIKRIEELESLLVESNEYARKLSTKVTDQWKSIELLTGLHVEAMQRTLDTMDIVDRLSVALDEITKCVPCSDEGGGWFFPHFDGEGNESGTESVSPEFVFQKMADIASTALCYPKGGTNQSDASADQNDSVKLRNQRRKDAGDRLFEELDDKTPEPNCRCHVFPPCSDCTNHASSREALKEWKEANK